MLVDTPTMTIVSLGDGAVQGDVALVLRPNNVLGHVMNTTLEMLTTTQVVIRPPAPSRGLGPWYHFCAAHDALNRHRLYVNGRVVAVDGRNVTLATTTTLVAGAFAVANTRNFDGFIEGLTLWNQALSDVEVFALWKRKHPLNVRRSAIIACYPDMGAKAPTVVEDIANGNDLATITDAPQWHPDSPRFVYDAHRKYFFASALQASVDNAKTRRYLHLLGR
jgi:hypothetical protein